MIRTYELSPRSKTPLYAQLYEAIRADILSGLLPGGEKLPSKRALAEHLSLSKITVETAYAQLLDEGYLTSRAILWRICRFWRSRLSVPQVCRKRRRSRKSRRVPQQSCFRFPCGQS